MAGIARVAGCTAISTRRTQIAIKTVYAYHNQGPLDTARGCSTRTRTGPRPDTATKFLKRRMTSGPSRARVQAGCEDEMARARTRRLEAAQKYRYGARWILVSAQAPADGPGPGPLEVRTEHRRCASSRRDRRTLRSAGSAGRVCRRVSRVVSTRSALRRNPRQRSPCTNRRPPLLTMLTCARVIVRCNAGIRSDRARLTAGRRSFVRAAPPAHRCYYLHHAPGCGVRRDRKSTRLNSSHSGESRMPSSA